MESSGIGNEMQHILEGTESFLKSEDAEQSPIDVSGLAWQSGFLPLGTWVREQEELDSSAALPQVIFDGSSYLGRGSEVTPQVLVGETAGRKYKNTEKAGEQP